MLLQEDESTMTSDCFDQIGQILCLIRNVPIVCRDLLDVFWNTPVTLSDTVTRGLVNERLSGHQKAEYKFVWCVHRRRCMIMQRVIFLHFPF